MKWSTVLAVSLVGGLFLRGGQTQAAPPRSQPVRVSVKAGKTGELISKYIYGQFIEHLGRSHGRRGHHDGQDQGRSRSPDRPG